MKYFYISVALNVLTALLILTFLSILPPVVPLLYGKPIGEPQLVPTIALFGTPLTGLLIVIINFLLIKFSVKDLFLQKILNWASILVSILASITVVKIIFLVGTF